MSNSNINKVSNEALEKIKKKSILVAPNNATEKGLTPNTIKKLLTDPMFGEQDSIIAEINKVVDEINNKVIFVDQYNLDKEQINSRFEEVSNEIQGINGDITELENSIKNVDDKTLQINVDIEQVNSKIQSIQNRLTTTENKLQELIDELYEVGEGNSESNVAIELLKNRVTTIEDAYIKSVVYNVQNGIFTFTKQDGTIFEVDLAIEKVVANFTYNQSANALELMLADGTVQTVPMSDFAKAFEGVENEQIQVVVQSGNRIQAILKDSSVTYEKLSDDVKEMLERGGSSSGESNDFATEQRLISDWSALETSEEPYTHYSEVTLSTLTKAKSVELINDQPVLFAKHGFAIASIVGNVVKVYSIEKPVDDVTLKFELRFSGTVEQLLLQSLEGVC